MNTDTSIESLAWTDAYLVGYAPMDKTHREFVEIVGAMLTAPDKALPGYFQALIKHCEEHFSQEERLMNSTDFPATECHTNEHNAVLTSIREVAAYIEGGGEAIEARRLATELARWFPGHTDYLDASLAQWVVKKKIGGVPIVVRRGVTYSEEN